MVRKKDVSEEEAELIIKLKLKLKREKLSRIKAKDKAVRVKTSVNADADFDIELLFSKKWKVQTSTVKKIKEFMLGIKITSEVGRMQLKMNPTFFSLKILLQIKITSQS